MEAAKLLLDVDIRICEVVESVGVLLGGNDSDFEVVGSLEVIADDVVVDCKIEEPAEVVFGVIVTDCEIEDPDTEEMVDVVVDEALLIVVELETRGLELAKVEIDAEEVILRDVCTIEVEVIEAKALEVTTSTAEDDGPPEDLLKEEGVFVDEVEMRAPLELTEDFESEIADESFFSDVVDVEGLLIAVLEVTGLADETNEDPLETDFEVMDLLEATVAELCEVDVIVERVVNEPALWFVDIDLVNEVLLVLVELLGDSFVDD